MSEYVECEKCEAELSKRGKSKRPARNPAPFRRWSVAYEFGVPVQLLRGGEVVLVLRAVAGQNPLAADLAKELNRARVVLPKGKP